MKTVVKPEIRYRASSYCTCDCHDGKGFTIWHGRCADLHVGKPKTIEITEEQFRGLADARSGVADKPE